MKLQIIGAGNLATNLALSARDCGHEIVGVVSRTAAHALELARLADCPWSTSVDAISDEVEICVIAVSDDALPHVISTLPRREGTLFVHTAGSQPMSIFDGRERMCGVWYPMQSFSKQRRVNFKNISCFLEANTPEASERLRQFAYSLSDNLYQLPTPQRQMLHLAAVFASNFSNHCYTLASQLAQQAGVPFSALLPLIDETTAKVHQLSPLDAQTGPARRGDREGVAREGRLLQGQPDLMAIYALLNRSIEAAERERQRSIATPTEGKQL